jgi:hypothetical protein
MITSIARFQVAGGRNMTSSKSPDFAFLPEGPVAASKCALGFVFTGLSVLDEKILPWFAGS